jgi:uncharacterized protein (DUF2062 family)
VFRRRHQIPPWQRLRRWLWPHIGWRRMGTYVVKRATRLSGTPHSIAAGAACGVAISFTPFIGFHLLGAFLLCLLVRGNYLAAAAGTLVGNPWTFPFVWVATYQLGHVLLGSRPAQIEPVEHWDLATFFVEVEAVFWPMGVGGFPLALVAGLATYLPLMRMIAAYQEARARRRQSRRGLKAQGASSDVGVP